MSESEFHTSFEIPDKPALAPGDQVFVSDYDGNEWLFFVEDVQPAPGELPLKESPHVVYGRAFLWAG